MSAIPSRQPFSRIPTASFPSADLNFQGVQRFLEGLYVPLILTAARSPHPVKSTDWLILCNCTDGAITLAFPDAGRVDGLDLVVVKTDNSANAVTLSATISGNASPTLSSPFAAAPVKAGNGVYYYASYLTSTAAKVAHSLTAGTHLTGGPYDGSAAVTLGTDATSTNTASTIMARDGSGNFSAGVASLSGLNVSGRSMLGGASVATGAAAIDMVTKNNSVFWWENPAGTGLLSLFWVDSTPVAHIGTSAAAIQFNFKDAGLGAMTLKELSLGATDSGGTGFRLMRVPN